MDTTGCYASFFNRTVEWPHRTIADMTRALYFNAGHSSDKWCFTAETAADNHFTLHSALGISPYEAWYGTNPSIHHLHIWGCTINVHVPAPTKSESRVHKWYFMGFIKSRSLLDGLTLQKIPSNTLQQPDLMNIAHYFHPQIHNLLAPYYYILKHLTICHYQKLTIDLTDHPKLTHPPFTLHLSLPPIGCTLASCL